MFLFIAFYSLKSDVHKGAVDSFHDLKSCATDRRESAMSLGRSHCFREPPAPAGRGPTRSYSFILSPVQTDFWPTRRTAGGVRDTEAFAVLPDASAEFLAPGRDRNKSV